MNPVLGAIIENLQGIQIIFEQTPKVFSKDKKHTADCREVSVKEFLESFLPPSFIVKKGLIYDKYTSSQEIDCVILAPNHPRLITPKREAIIAEGVYAAVEVKPNIAALTDSSEFRRGLTQMQSVKRLTRKIVELPHVPDLSESLDMPSWDDLSRTPLDLQRIPCVIFSNTSRKATDTVAYMKNCVAKREINSNELPDMIVTLDNGLIFHSTYIESTIFKSFSPDCTGEKYIIINLSNESLLGIFLLAFLSFAPPDILINEFILKDYLLQSVPKDRYIIVEA